MDNILSSVSMTTLLSNTTSVLSAIAPFLELLTAILLTFFIIDVIIKIISFRKDE